MKAIPLHPAPKSILIVRPDAIGDVVLIAPLINSIKATWPSTHIYLLQQPYTSDIYKNHPNVSGILLDEHRTGKLKGVTGFVAMLNQIKAYNFDMVLQPFLEPYYAQLMAAARIPIRIGDGNKIGLRPYLTHPVPLDFRDITLHETMSNVRLLTGVCPEAKVVPTMDIYPNPKEESLVKDILKQRGWTKEKLIGIHPTTGGGNRAWLPKLYAHLIELIHKYTTYRVVLTGTGAKDEAVNQEINRYLTSKAPVNMVNAVTVDQLKWVIKQCEVMVGTDTGPTHMAAALKIKVLCVSPTKFVKALRWGPWQTPNRVVGNSDECPLVCFPSKCKEMYCLDAISPNDVFNQLKELLQEDHFDEAESTLRWRKKSVNLAVYCGDDSPNNLSQALTKIIDLKQQEYNFHVIAATEEIKGTLNYQMGHIKNIHVIPVWRTDMLLSLISTRDINEIYVYPKAHMPYWTGVIRQLAALKLYCPPVIIGGSYESA